MLGANPLRPQEKGDGQSLWIQEVFYTLQGEGPFSGHPALFVRLAGCNLACYFCDTDFESSDWRPTLKQLLADIDRKRGEHCKLVVITGGEPFRQNILPLVEALHERDLTVQIETNGTLYLDLPWGEMLHVVCSPKTSGLHGQLVEHIDAYKYVLRAGEVDDEDGLPGCSTKYQGRPETIARPDHSAGPHRKKAASVYVMPQDDQDEQKNLANTQACIDSALKFGYKLTLQTHKLIGVR